MVRSSIKERKKRGPRLSDGVIVRQWCESECHYHVKESRAFCKTRAWSVQLTTPYGKNLTKVRDKLVSGHSLQMIIVRVVRICYPRDVQYLRYKIRSNYDTCTSECGNKLRHRGINAMYVRVKLLNKHDGTMHGFLTERFPSPSLNDIEQRSVREIRQNDLAFRMNTTGLEVLNEVRLGLLITKLNMKGYRRSKRRR